MNTKSKCPAGHPNHQRNAWTDQAEAGEVIGGGPRAFTKYEAGTVKPAASVVNLLRLLEANPRGIDVLKPDRQRPIADVPNSPFEVAGDHVSALNEQMLPVLTRKLLNAEADAYDLPAPVIHVASNIHAADGGGGCPHHLGRGSIRNKISSVTDLPIPAEGGEHR